MAKLEENSSEFIGKLFFNTLKFKCVQFPPDSGNGVPPDSDNGVQIPPGIGNGVEADEQKPYLKDATPY